MDRSNTRNALGGAFVVAMAMSLYAYLRLATNDLVLTLAIVALIALEVVRVVVARRSSMRLDIASDVIFFAVFASVILGVYRHSLASHPIFLFATIFYRPKFLRYGDRRLAFVLSLLIAVTVLPTTCGLVTDSGIVQLFTVLYAVLVFFLWISCSRLGAATIAHASAIIGRWPR